MSARCAPWATTPAPTSRAARTRSSVDTEAIGDQEDTALMLAALLADGYATLKLFGVSDLNLTCTSA